MTAANRAHKSYHKKARLEAFRLMTALEQQDTSIPKIAKLLERAKLDFFRHHTAYETGERGLTRRSPTALEQNQMTALLAQANQMPEQLPDDFDFNEYLKPVDPLKGIPITGKTREEELAESGPDTQSEALAAKDIQRMNEKAVANRAARIAEKKAADDTLFSIVKSDISNLGRGLAKKKDES